MLKISNLYVKADNKSILNGITLNLEGRKISVLMGPNGSGKTSLTKVLMGHPHFEVLSGEILFHDKNLLQLEPQERSHEGLFVAMQNPTEVPGVNFANFLRLSYNSRFKEKESQLPVFKFRKLLKEKLKFLNISEDFLERNLNEGFSGGEKKKAEILQMAILQPQFAVLDETDSGLDVDAMREVFEGVQKIMTLNKKMGLLIITHNEKLFNYIKPDKVFIIKNGEITEEGGIELIKEINQKGFKK